MLSLVSLATLTSCAAEHDIDVVETVTLPGGAQLQFVVAPFDSTGETISRVGNYVTAVGGRPIWGTDGSIPDSVLSRAHVLLGGVQVDLDVADMYNARPYARNMNVQQDQVLDRYTVTGLFSDGAGSFVASWDIANNVARRNIITNDDMIICVLTSDALEECF
jgi:hypothetical protein